MPVKAKKATWKKVANTDVRHTWGCSDPLETGCCAKTVVRADWYEQNGTPMCSECDADMEYLHTEVRS